MIDFDSIRRQKKLAEQQTQVQEPEVKAEKIGIPYDMILKEGKILIYKRVLEEFIKLVNLGQNGDHHLFVEIQTALCDIPKWLADEYPEKMIIVLQYQFYEFEQDDEKFSVTLSFHGKSERLHVPYKAITMMNDPSIGWVVGHQQTRTET